MTMNANEKNKVDCCNVSKSQETESSSRSESTSLYFLLRQDYAPEYNALLLRTDPVAGS